MSQVLQQTGTLNILLTLFPHFNSSNALASKFIVRLSSLAYNLLTLFLVQSDLVLIASIINNKVSFKKLDDAQAQAPSDLHFQEVLLVELPGYTAGSLPFLACVQHRAVFIAICAVFRFESVPG